MFIHGWANTRQLPVDDNDTKWHHEASLPADDILFPHLIGDVLNTLDVDVFSYALSGIDALAPGVPVDPALTTDRGLAARSQAATEALMRDVERSDPFRATRLADELPGRVDRMLSRPNR